MAEIIWTETALSDIDNIAAYIAQDSYFYATQFVRKIFLVVKKLEKYPEIGKAVPELIAYEYREILLNKYRIIYRKDASFVYIISVHHSARLLINNDHFKNLFDND